MYCKNVRLVYMHWHDLFLFILAPIHLQMLITGVKAATPSLLSCPQYVPENGLLTCTCSANDCQGSYTLSWVNITPPYYVLLVPQVKREDDGKRYTCQLDCEGQTTTVDYTLRVAYGPNSDNMSVSGALPFKTNGTQVLNLTCLATNVHPAAEYFWRGSLCGNAFVNNTCSFVPQREDDMKVATCLARNTGISFVQSSKNVTIDLRYTPPASPHIQGPGQIVKAGDTLSCSVTDGKPLVQSVSFSCDNPHHPDQNDAVNSTYVTSYITIDTSNATDENMTCHCSALWAPEPSYYTTSVSDSFRTAYPPRGGPSIYISPTNQILKSGDSLFCKVDGGKPPVENITFYCMNQGKGDNGFIQNKTVTSKLTIDTSKATDDNMTCHCSAHWKPAPGHYTKSASASFRTEYPAKIETFTLNDNVTVTVTASDKINVTLMCEAHGLPSPTILLQGPHDHDLTGNLTYTEDTDSRMEHTIVADNDTHMGNYTCKAVNGVTNVTVTSLVTLNVNFPPRLASSDGPGHSRDTAVNMPENGIEVALKAYPTPDSFRFTDYKDRTSPDGVDVSSDSGMFSVSASQKGPGSPEVTCHIRPGSNVKKGWLYMVTISNGFGSVQYYFNVTGVPSPPDSEGVNIGLIFGVVFGGLAALILIIATVYCCCCKGKEKEEESYKHQISSRVNDSGTQARPNPAFNKDDHSNNSGIGERESPPLVMSASTPDSKSAQDHTDAGYVGMGEVRDGVMRNKSARGQAYEVTSLVKGGGARIAGETTKPPTTNSKVGYTEPWTDYHTDMPDGQPSVNKPPADTTRAHAGNKDTPDHYQGPRGEEYASVGAHGKGGPHFYLNVDPKQKTKPPYSNVPDDRPSEVNASGVFESPGYSPSHNKGTKASGKGKQSGAVSTDARGSDTYDHFGRQGHDPAQIADPTYNHIGKF